MIGMSGRRMGGRTAGKGCSAGYPWCIKQWLLQSLPKVGRNDGREPRAMAMSNHCFVWCQMPRVTRLLEDGEQGESLQDLTCGVAVRRTANSSATTLL